MGSPPKTFPSFSVQGPGPSASQPGPPPTAKPLIEPLHEDEPELYGSTGLLIPFYLFPLIYQGSPECLCLYSLLLPLCWWMTNSVPRCVAALAPFVTLPVLRTLGADEAAAAFLTPASLKYLIFLVIVTASHTSGRLIPRLSFNVCSKYGLQVLPLFLWLTALTYMMSLFVPKAAVALLLILAVDKILTCVHDCDLDRTLIEHEEQRCEQKMRELQASVAFSEATAEEAALMMEPSGRVVTGQLDRECAESNNRNKEKSVLDRAPSVTFPSDKPSVSAPSLAVVDALATASGVRPQTSSKNGQYGTKVPQQYSPTSSKFPEPPSAKDAEAEGDKQAAEDRTDKQAAEDRTGKQAGNFAMTTESNKSKHSQDKSTVSMRKKKRGKRSKSPNSPKSPNRTASPKHRRKRSRASRTEGVIEASRDQPQPKATQEMLTPHGVTEPSATTTAPGVHATQPVTAAPDNQAPDDQAPDDRAPDDQAPDDQAPDDHATDDEAPKARRPSILKMRPLRKKSWVSLLGVNVGAGSEARRHSTVGFGADECQFTIAEVPQQQETQQLQASREGPHHSTPSSDVAEAVSGLHGPDSGGHAQCTGANAVGAPAALTSPGAVSGASNIASPPHPPEAALRPALEQNASVGFVSDASVLSPTEVKLVERIRAHTSQRTAFLLCCSLVTMTASLSSMITVAAREALVQHAVIKRGIKGVLSWFLLVTPTALLATASCCVPLYMLHLRNRQVYNKEDTQGICLAATTELNKLGPIRGGELLLAYVFVCYIMFVCLGPVLGYNGRKHMLSFLTMLLVVLSMLPSKWRGFFKRKHRLIVWTAMSRDVPWAVVVIHCSVQLTTSVFRSNQLLPACFEMLGTDFWGRNSLVVNQVVIGAIGSVLAEAINNNHLCDDIVPLVMEIAEENAVPPAAYAVPAAVGASCNLILPIHLPMIVANEVIEVPMVQVAMIGILAKAITVVSSIVSVNTYGSHLIPWSDVPSTNSTDYTGASYSIEF